MIAYTYSTGLEALKTKGSFAEPDDRVKQGLPYRPSGSSRGRGIGQMGRAAVKTLTDLDETIRLSESDIRRLIKELLHTKLI